MKAVSTCGDTVNVQWSRPETTLIRVLRVTLAATWFPCLICTEIVKMRCQKVCVCYCVWATILCLVGTIIGTNLVGTIIASQPSCAI